MLTITSAQIDSLNLASYRRHCIEFARRELRLFDHDVPIQELQSLFEEFSSVLDLESRADRITLILLLISRFAFDETFTQQAISHFLRQPLTSDDRQAVLQRALLQHADYDAEYLRRKTWI